MKSIVLVATVMWFGCGSSAAVAVAQEENRDQQKSVAGTEAEKQDRAKTQEGKRRRGKDGPPGQRLSANPEQRIAALLKRFDANADGAISTDEIPEQLADRISRWDANDDGVIDAEELKMVAARGRDAQGRRRPDGDRPSPPGGERSGRMPDPTQMFRRLDKDSNGSLSKDEVPERLAERFEQIDLDGNGELTESELAELREMMGGRKPGKGGENSESDSAPQKPKRPTGGGA